MIRLLDRLVAHVDANLPLWLAGCIAVASLVVSVRAAS